MVVVVVFVMMVMLMPLHYLCQPTFIQHHTGQLPHLLFFHHWTWCYKRAQGPVALALFWSLFVFAVGSCRLMRGDLTGKSWGRGSTSAPHHPATDLHWRCATVGLRRPDGMPPWVLAFEAGGMNAGVWNSSSVHNCLQTALVGMGGSIFRFLGARTSLVRWTGLSLHLSWFCSRSWNKDMDTEVYFKQLWTKKGVPY